MLLLNATFVTEALKSNGKKITRKFTMTINSKFMQTIKNDGL